MFLNFEGLKKQRVLFWALLFVLFAAFARMVFVAWANSQDFSVYWRAGSQLLSAVNPYSAPPEAQGFVFKYPPWVLPFFIPFGFAPWGAAKILWAVLSLGALSYSFVWVFKRAESKKAVVLSVALYWWIFLGHLSMGQVSLLVLAAVLFALERQRAASSVGAVFGLSAKVFSLVSLPAFGMGLRNRRVWLIVGIVFLLAHGVVFLFLKQLNPFLLYQSWLAAAASGGEALGEEVVRGAHNHGLPAAAFRWLGIRSTASLTDTFAFAVFALGLGGLWWRFGGKLRDHERQAGWLALGVICHPLAWHHSFVLAWPLSAFALSAAIRSGSRVESALAIMGTVMVGVLIPQVLGTEWVQGLEWLGVKSFGVLLSAAVLLRVPQQRLSRGQT